MPSPRNQLTKPFWGELNLFGGDLWLAKGGLCLAAPFNESNKQIRGQIEFCTFYRKIRLSSGCFDKSRFKANLQIKGLSNFAEILKYIRSITMHQSFSLKLEKKNPQVGSYGIDLLATLPSDFPHRSL